MEDTSETSEMQAKHDNVLVKLWKKTGFRLDMIMLSLKGALPSTIAIAAYQAPAWAKLYTTLGYFVAVVAMLSMAMQPRAKFFQTISTNAIFICTATAVNLLMIRCVIAARDPANNQGLHTGSSGSIEATPYDSSANAVAAVWLFVIVFGANYLRPKRPQLSVGAINFNVYSVTASIYAPSFPNMAAGLAFSRRLLITFLTAYAIAAAVNVLIWPTTSRGEVKRQSAKLLSAFKDYIESYKAYTDSFGKSATEGEASDDQADLVKKLKDQSRATSDQFGKIKTDLEYARKEVAYGNLSPDNLKELYVGMREVLQPVMGLSTFLQIVDDAQHSDKDIETGIPSRIQEAIRDLKEDEWCSIMTTFRESHTRLQDVMCEALDHISHQLRLKSHLRFKRADIENSIKPQSGDLRFAKHFEQELLDYQARHDRLVHTWREQNQARSQRGNPGSRMSSDETNGSSTLTRVDKNSEQNQLNLILYLDFLLYNTGQALLRQVQFADGLVTDGTMTRNRFIFPGCRAVGNLMMGAFMDPGQDEAMGINADNGSNIWVGDLFKNRKDPEHMEPMNTYERITDYLRRIPRELSSSHANYGLRTAVATLSIALVGFLAQTRPFFLDQRGIWAVSTTAIAMTPRLGTSVSAFCMRILGTAIAAGVSIAISYIADHNVAGIIVLFYLQAFCWLLFVARFPSFEITGVIGSVAVIIIVGYQLQVDVIGLAEATSNGEAYYPIYLLAPYRLGAIAAGVAVAFFWSLFPFPVTSHGSLRHDTANALYILANYNSCVHATLDVYPHFGSRISELSDEHPAKRLEEARQEVFGKSISMLGNLRDHLSASKYEPRIGGRFPHDQYEEVIESLSHIFTYLALITYSSKAFIRDSDHANATDKTTGESENEKNQERLRRLRDALANSHPTSQKLTSTLCLLASSVREGEPLPPYLSLTRHHDPAESLTASMTEAPGTQQLIHPYQAAITINEISGSLINGEIAKLTELIKGLVGEIDFTFHIMSTSDDSQNTLVNTYSNSVDEKNWAESVKVKKP